MQGLVRRDLRFIADVITTAALSPQLFKDPEFWSVRGLNLRPPAQQTGALPTVLTGRRSAITRNTKTSIKTTTLTNKTKRRTMIMMLITTVTKPR